MLRRAFVIAFVLTSVAASTALAAPPYQSGAPWPQHRHDAHNTGRADLGPAYRGGRPWSFVTGKGIFSSPVVARDGTVYIGSADGNVYALDGASGRQRWRFHTRGIIDAAGVLGNDGTFTVGSGDEVLYQLRTAPRAKPRVVWRYKAHAKTAGGQLVNWWEGNVTLGPDGNLYTGNTGGAMYSFTRAGKLRWTHQTGNSVWTTPAFGPHGETFWGSVDLFIYSLDAAGAQRWRRPTVGFVTSSPAIGDDGTVYIGSFDSKLYALDPDTGLPKWTFATTDHIYASPALGADGTIYIGSADGSMYAITKQGRLRWRYDTGDPVRSSPVVGRGVVYFGSSNGKLYALDAATGKRRWSFDTTPADPALQDRNDLNGSPALGRRGVYIGGEHGRVWFVPFDWCRTHRDRRCSTDPGQEFGETLTRVFRVTPGGTTVARGTGRQVPAGITLPLRLVVRDHGQTLDAGFERNAVLVTANPPFDFSAELSGDHHVLHVQPNGALRPGTRYALHVHGRWSAQGVPVGNQTVGATKFGTVDDRVSFRTAPVLHRGAPLKRGTSFALRRLAVPLPAFITSVNQIGFDSYDLMAGTVQADRGRRGKVLVWLIGGRRDAHGKLHPDPKAGFAFPLSGSFADDTLLLSGQMLDLTFSFGEVPFRRFDVRGQMGPDLRMRPGANLYAEVTCSDVPTYGPALFVIGLCDPVSNTLPASGAFLTDPLPRATAPAGVRVRSLTLTRPTGGDAGSAVAQLSGRFAAARHQANILLTDAATGEPVALSYPKDTTITRDAAGSVSRVTLAIPAGTALPARVRAIVMTDVYPLAARTL